MISLILAFIFLICGIILFYKANQIKINKNEQQEQYKKILNHEIDHLQLEKYNLLSFKNEKEKELNKELLQFQESRKKEIEAYLESQQQLAKQTINKTNQSVQKQIEDIKYNVQCFQNNAEVEKQNIQNEINKLKASLSAGVQARLREQEKKDKLGFYKLSINDADLSDVKMLENLKTSFHKPVVLSKLIWTQYFQKQMTELCDRVLGKKTICGIYKITNLLTAQCYIGQSVNIGDRWKQHCKCGLGIEASATNKLYNSMQKDGVWNFSFELLEQCSKDILNEKEKFWIQMYQSNKFGLNTVKGNS